MHNNFKDELSKIKNDYYTFCDKKDEQSLFYFDQMIELFYSELSNQINNKILLRNIIFNLYRKNIMIIFNNMKDYTKQVSKKGVSFINEYINVSYSNRYIDIESLNSIYKNFSNEINKNLNIEEKIKVLVSSNIDILTGQLYSKFTFNNSHLLDEIINKYKSIFFDEIIGNLLNKKNYLLSLYQNFIDSILYDFYEEKNEIKEKNEKMIINTSYNLLKEKECININKNINLNTKLINDVFDSLEKELKKISIMKKDIQTTKDYFHSFNNTLCVKTKNIFDEMNLVIMLENNRINEEIKKFNELITHIFEMNLVFDKQFFDYKKKYTTLGKDENKLNEIVNIKSRMLTDGIKANLFNIFRENIKIYNDIVYKTLLLKSKAGDYNVILDTDKIKDLLLK